MRPRPIIVALAGPLGLCVACSDPPPKILPRAQLGPEHYEDSAPIDLDAAHRHAWQQARPLAITFATKLETWGPLATADQRRELASALTAVLKTLKGLDAARLDNKAGSEYSATILLTLRARDALDTSDGSRVDPHLFPRAFALKQACAERSLVRSGSVASTCLEGLSELPRLLDVLRATSPKALAGAQDRLADQCKRLPKLERVKPWKEWVKLAKPVCETGRRALAELQGEVDEASASSEAWSRKGLGRNTRARDTATPFPPVQLARRWFKSASGWSGSEQAALRSGHAVLALMQSQVRVHRGAENRGSGFSSTHCDATVARLSESAKRAGFTGGFECARLELAATGRSFTAGEQDSWTLRRGALDSEKGSSDPGDEILRALRSPVLPVLELHEASILHEAGLDESSQVSQAKVIERLCAAMVYAELMVEAKPVAPASCASSTAERALRDPFRAIWDLELAFLPTSGGQAKDVLQGHWLPLGWRILQAAERKEDASTGPEGPEGPKVRMKTEINEQPGEDPTGESAS